MIAIYNDLRGSENDFDTPLYSDSQLYLVSRQFITSFRKHLEKKIKPINKLLGDLDSLDFDELQCKEESESDETNLDVKVNSNITCE
jgi:hypothetical protein